MANRRGFCLLVAGRSIGDEAVAGVNEMETAAGREPVERELVASILADLEHEGFCSSEGDRWLSV